MQPQEIILLAVVLLFGVSAACRNPTAGALVIAYVASRSFYLTTGIETPDLVKFTLDVAVIGIICCKPERTPADRMVAFIYPAEWVIYVSPINPVHDWWLLWILSIAQFLIIFIEAAQSYRSERRYARLWRRPPPGWFSIPGRCAWDLSN